MGNATAAEAGQLGSDVAAILNNTTTQQQRQKKKEEEEEEEEAANGGSSSLSGVGVGGLTLAAAARPVEVCVQLPEGVELLHTAATRNPEEDNCCVEVYYQVGGLDGQGGPGGCASGGAQWVCNVQRSSPWCAQQLLCEHLCEHKVNAGKVQVLLLCASSACRLHFAHTCSHTQELLSDRYRSMPCAAAGVGVAGWPGLSRPAAACADRPC